MTMDLDEIEAQVERIANMADPNDENVGELLLLTCALNEQLGRHDLSAQWDFNRIRKVVERLQQAAKNLANSTGATSFSVTAGLPTGVSVTIEWPTT